MFSNFWTLTTSIVSSPTADLTTVIGQNDEDKDGETQVMHGPGRFSAVVRVNVFGPDMSVATDSKPLVSPRSWGIDINSADTPAKHIE